MASREPKSEALRDIYWRDEILEVVLWLRGEGFDERIDAGTLVRFLGLEAGRAGRYLERMVADGWLRRLPDDRYGLTARGEVEGARLTGSARTTRPEEGPCGPFCFCHSSAVEAVACESQRSP